MDNLMNNEDKYIKYKTKYLELKNNNINNNINNNMIGGGKKKQIKTITKKLINNPMDNLMNIIQNFNKYINNCKKMKQKLPWEQKINPNDTGVKMLINDHLDFFTEAKNKYVKLYPKSTVLINDVEENINKLTIEKIVRNKKDENDFWKVINKITTEFMILHPKLYSEYFGWCSYHKCNLPKQDILDIMLMTNVDELFNFLIKKIK
jgi:hypothetical protein